MYIVRHVRFAWMIFRFGSLLAAYPAMIVRFIPTFTFQCDALVKAWCIVWMALHLVSVSIAIGSVLREGLYPGIVSVFNLIVDVLILIWFLFGIWPAWVFRSCLREAKIWAISLWMYDVVWLMVSCAIFCWEAYDESLEFDYPRIPGWRKTACWKHLECVSYSEAKLRIAKGGTGGVVVQPNPKVLETLFAISSASQSSRPSDYEGNSDEAIFWPEARRPRASTSESDASHRSSAESPPGNLTPESKSPNCDSKAVAHRIGTRVQSSVSAIALPVSVKVPLKEIGPCPRGGGGKHLVVERAVGSPAAVAEESQRGISCSTSSRLRAMRGALYNVTACSGCRDEISYPSPSTVASAEHGIGSERVDTDIAHNDRGGTSQQDHGGDMTPCGEVDAGQAGIAEYSHFFSDDRVVIPAVLLQDVFRQERGVAAGEKVKFPAPCRILPELPPPAFSQSSSDDRPLPVRRAHSEQPMSRSKRRGQPGNPPTGGKQRGTYVVQMLEMVTDWRHWAKIAEVEERDCPICFVHFEDDDDVILLPCDVRHVFHLKCIMTWLCNRSNLCPVCRADLASKVREKQQSVNFTDKLVQAWQEEPQRPWPPQV